MSPLPEKLIHRKIVLAQVAGVFVVALSHRRCRCCGDVSGGRGPLLEQKRSASVSPELVRLNRKKTVAYGLEFYTYLCDE